MINREFLDDIINEEKKKHAIEFVHFVLSNLLYKEDFNPHTMGPEEIYKAFLNQNKDE